MICIIKCMYVYMYVHVCMYVCNNGLFYLPFHTFIPNKDANSLSESGLSSLAPSPSGYVRSKTSQNLAIFSFA